MFVKVAEKTGKGEGGSLKLSFIKLNYKRKIFFFLVFYTRKNFKNEAKIYNIADIRRNVIQNLEVEIDHYVLNK